jgi:tetratricopeptide (TPR) repeat protein
VLPRACVPGPIARGARALSMVLATVVLTGATLAAAAAPAATGSPATTGASNAGAPRPPVTPAYVGAVKCAPCHEPETKLWRGSHHDHAMEPATAATVRGDFSGKTFVKDGVTTTFSRRGDAYVVRTDGPDGTLRDYPVKYTFGWDPLQQYLLELPGGRLQALSVAWDTRPKADGGQRWFHLYPNEKIDHADVLHWTGPAQNWNHMCAECHSTNLVKGYDASKDTFATTWSDLNVACEACHGPGSAHVAWADAANAGKASDDARKGLVFQLHDESGGAWQLAPGASIAHRTKAPSSDAQVETCARCHSRRAQLWSDYRHGEPLAQTHRLSLLDDGLYEADGTIHDEVYEHGSFLQSRMHAAGVRCADCHDPHSLALRAPGNGVCTQCHVATTYDAASHHHHTAGTKAAQCASCHMPERFYMVVDGRHDHGFRVPRPDLSITLGTPNACNDCHKKEDARWASDALDRWYGATRVKRASFAADLHAGRGNASDAPGRLEHAARDRSNPAIARASAIELLAAHPGPDTVAVLRDAVRDPDPLVRRAAAGTVVALDPQNRVALVAPLLRDPVRTVRIEALGSLLDVPPDAIPAASRDDLERAIAEYRAVQATNADRADARANLGALEARLGNADAARSELNAAMRLQPTFAPAYENLAEVERRAGNEQAADAALRRGVVAVPGVASLHHALGLSLVRQKRVSEALPELERAVTLAPQDSRYAYVLGVALHDSGQRERSLRVLTEAAQRNPGVPELYAALVQYAGEAGDRTAALAWARKLYDATGDPRVAAMIEAQQGATHDAPAAPPAR